MPPVRDRVEAQDQRVRLAREERVGEERREGRAAARRERAREVHDLLALRVEHGEGRVQVVEARVDQLQADRRTPEVLLRLGRRERRGAEAVPREEPPARHGEVPLALVDLHGHADVRPAPRREPRPVRHRLRLPLREGEPRPEHAPADHRRPVRRVHHVRQPRLRVEHVHGMPERPVAGHEPLPLRERPRPVHGRARVHPGVDRVTDLEVLRGAHQVVARARLAGARGTDHGNLLVRGVRRSRGPARSRAARRRATPARHGHRAADAPRRSARRTGERRRAPGNGPRP
ncbi:hypothetical protein STTU_5037 [Streptomyces sp. Tu6071]|nr:hypothetical protein STTU_5037 [Streptomyces sp. Tu6071]